MLIIAHARVDLMHKDHIEMPLDDGNSLLIEGLWLGDLKETLQPIAEITACHLTPAFRIQTLKSRWQRHSGSHALPTQNL